jgi:dimethylargininase
VARFCIVRPVQATRALVRGISATFRDAVVMHPTAEAIDVDRARLQHAEYVRALESAGLVVERMPSLDSHPDACFVEDCALVLGTNALVTRPGTPSRLGETDSVAARLSALLGVEGRVERTHAPATIDGGDCLRVGKTWFVGRSSRTNGDGVRRVREVFGPLGLSVAEVPVEGFLHLKCVVSRIDDGAVLVAEGMVDPAAFAGIEVVTIPREEMYAANAVVVNGTAIIAKGYPHTREAFERRGLRIVELALSEIAKADGSLTCMSILLD